MKITVDDQVLESKDTAIIQIDGKPFWLWVREQLLAQSPLNISAVYKSESPNYFEDIRRRFARGVLVDNELQIARDLTETQGGMIARRDEWIAGLHQMKQDLRKLLQESEQKIAELEASLRGLLEQIGVDYVPQAVVAFRDLRTRNQELEQHVATDEKLLTERDALLDMIPPCPEHGARCIPHAKEWIVELQKRNEGLEQQIRTGVVLPAAQLARLHAEVNKRIPVLPGSPYLIDELIAQLEGMEKRAAEFESSYRQAKVDFVNARSDLSQATTIKDMLLADNKKLEARIAELEKVLGDSVHIDEATEAAMEAQYRKDLLRERDSQIEILEQTLSTISDNVRFVLEVVDSSLLHQVGEESNKHLRAIADNEVIKGATIQVRLRTALLNLRTQQLDNCQRRAADSETRRIENAKVWNDKLIQLRGDGEQFRMRAESLSEQQNHILDDVLLLLATHHYPIPEKTYRNDGGWGLALSDLKRCFSDLEQRARNKEIAYNSERKLLNGLLEVLSKHADPKDLPSAPFNSSAEFAEALLTKLEQEREVAQRLAQSLLNTFANAQDVRTVLTESQEQTLFRLQQAQAAKALAERSLRAAGFTYAEGAEAWKPPVNERVAELLGIESDLDAWQIASAPDGEGQTIRWRVNTVLNLHPTEMYAPGLWVLHKSFTRLLSLDELKELVGEWPEDRELKELVGEWPEDRELMIAKRLRELKRAGDILAELKTLVV